MKKKEDCKLPSKTEIPHKIIRRKNADACKSEDWRGDGRKYKSPKGLESQ